MELTDLLAKVVITNPQVSTRLSEYAARMQPSTVLRDVLAARELAAKDGRRRPRTPWASSTRHGLNVGPSISAET